MDPQSSYSSPGRLIPRARTNGHPAPHRNEKVHVLVPTSLSDHERAAVLLGLRLAQADKGQMTLLRVLPKAESPSSMFWLDAIEQLHESRSRRNGRGRIENDAAAVNAAVHECQCFLEEFPRAARAGVDIRIECRFGEPASEAARFAEGAGVTVIVMCCESSSVSLRRWPGQAKDILKLTHRQVVFVRPELVSRHGRRNGVSARNGS